MASEGFYPQPAANGGTTGARKTVSRGHAPLTAKAVENARPGPRDYKLSDNGGLYLYVTSSGGKSWRLKYRFAGKEHRLVFGRFPELSLKDARNLRDDAKRLLAEGSDPKRTSRRGKLLSQVAQDKTFERYARDWHAAQLSRWKPVHADDVIKSLERDLLPAIGRFPITEIDEPLLLAALQSVEQRGAIETARRLRQRAERIFKFARASGGKNANPAIDIIEAMEALPRKRRWPAITDERRLAKLIADVDGAVASPVVRLASRFLALTAQRPGMVRGLPWHEIEGVAWAKPEAPAPDATWRIPSDRMKLEYDLREDEAWDHLVPLSPQSVVTLRAVRRITGRGPLAFPSNRDARDPMSENALGYLYNRLGYKGLHVPHGWRSSFSTIMNARAERADPGGSRLLIDRLIIDLMLAHAPSGMSADEFTYNRHGYMDRRRELAKKWADIVMTGASKPESLLPGRRLGSAVANP